MVREAEFRVWQLGAENHGIVTRRQALACGMTEAMIRSRVRSNEWTFVKPGVYLLPGQRSSLRGLLAAATASLGAVVSHEAAAELHGFSYVRRGMAVVTVPIRRTNRFPGVMVHQSTDLTASYVMEIDHLPVTNVVRTVVDLAAVVRARRLDRIVERCVLDRKLELAQLRAVFERITRHGKPGMSRLRLVLDTRMPGYIPLESDLEISFAEFVESFGFPRPVRQMDLPWRTPKQGRVDFAYPRWKIIVELDGRAWHGMLDQFDEDRMRNNLAQIAGWRVLRITYRMLIDRPNEVRELLARVLTGAAA